MNTETFKVTFENTSTGKKSHFFVNDINGILSDPHFTRKIKMETENGTVETTLREEILKKISKLVSEIPRAGQLLREEIIKEISPSTSTGSH
jgi:hypothetical protein